MFNILDKNYWYIFLVFYLLPLPHISNNMILGSNIYYHISNLSIKHFILLSGVFM